MGFVAATLQEPPIHLSETTVNIIMIVLLVVTVAWVVLFVFEMMRRTRRQYLQAAAKPLVEPGMTLEKYGHEAFDWIDDLGTGKFKIQWKGLWWRMLKLYWKRILFILLCLALPGIGWVVLFVCVATWALNWSNGITALMEAEFERFKREEAIRRNKPSARAARAVSRAVRKSLWFTVRGTWRGLWRARRAWKDLKEGR